MKILKLSAENVKRLVAVEITPDGAVVTVGGKNGAGKSSVLDSIAYALGGQALVPAVPIRNGQAEAKIEVDLGSLIVIRKFKREKVDNAWGPTKSVLIVKNKLDGAVHPSPQAILDNLIGKLTFDPLAFSEAKPAEQLETLRQLTNLDTSLLESQRKAAYDRRTLLKKQHAEKLAQHNALPHYDNVTETSEISMEEVSGLMLKAEVARKAADDAEREVSAASHALVNEGQRLAAHKATLEEMEKAVLRQQKLISDAERVIALKKDVLKDVTAEHEKLKAAIPDTSLIRVQIGQIEIKNLEIRANQKVAESAAALAALDAQIKSETTKITEADAKKEQLVSSVKFPVEGLGLSETGVTFNGIPFEQASRAEQIRVSVAMGFALNPKLKVLLVRDGSALDSDSLRLLTEQAVEADAQVWLERVAETKDGVSVMIEDGSVL